MIGNQHQSTTQNFNKNSESTVHRSMDCIVAGSKTGVPTNESTMKVAPSWSNVAQRSESISSTTGVVQSGGSKKASIDNETNGKFCSQISSVYIYMYPNDSFPLVQHPLVSHSKLIDLCELSKFQGYKSVSMKSKKNSRSKTSRRRNTNDNDDTNASDYARSNRSIVELFCVGRGKGSLWHLCVTFVCTCECNRHFFNSSKNSKFAAHFHNQNLCQFYLSIPHFTNSTCD